MLLAGGGTENRRRAKYNTGPNAAAVKIAPFAECVIIFSAKGRSAFAFEGRLDSSLLDEVANLVCQQQISMLGFPAQFDRVFRVTHNSLTPACRSSLRSLPIGGSTNPDSNFIPRLRPSCSSLSLISFNDFLPKFRYFSISASVFMAN